MAEIDPDAEPEHRTATNGTGSDRTPRENEDRFRRLVESVVDYAIFILDVSGNIASWNAGAERTKGYTAAEIIGKHFSIFYPVSDTTGARCERELAIAEREGRFEEEGWRVRKDGAQFWAYVVITAIRGADGRLLGFGKVTRDLTERRSAETRLKESEERLRLLIASVKDYAIFILDPTGHVATWNPGAERLKGFAAEEILGQHFSRFYPESDTRADTCERELEVALGEGRFEDEGWRIKKDGSRFWANVVITPIRDSEGHLRGFAKVTRDLSERRRHEQERITLARAEEGRRIAELNEESTRAHAEDLRRARDKAEEATRLKDEFLATISHELRTPLNSMLGWARMLHSGVLSKEKQAHAIETIVRNATAQSQIIDDLLDVSRIIAGKLRLEIDRVDMNQIVTSAVEVVRPAADAKGVALEWDFNPDAGVIQGDAGRLQQILWNVLTNAVKFTPRGGRVAVSLRRDDSNVEIHIADTGRGISPEFLPHMFERFTQEEASHSRKTGGMGLGLAIVKHLVELHGGTVQARSDGEGAGSTFVLRLPISPVGATRPEVRASISAGNEDLKFPAELRGLTVLILDDERDARELMQAVLERGGARVTLVSSTQEALESVRNRRPDVIVSDIGMPEEDGYVFIRTLRGMSREDGGQIPAVALTAYARAEDRRRALLAGFQNHAAKPIEPQELVMVIANLTRRYA